MIVFIRPLLKTELLVVKAKVVSFLLLGEGVDPVDFSSLPLAGRSHGNSLAVVGVFIFSPVLLHIGAQVHGKGLNFSDVFSFTKAIGQWVVALADTRAVAA